MPGAGLEPAWAFKVPQDFKSCASANFAIPAVKSNNVAPSTLRATGAIHKKRESRRGAESNRRIQVLQTRALPLCYRALNYNKFFN